MYKKLSLALFSGVILSLSFPPFKLGFLAYFGLIPLFILLNNENYKGAMKWGYLTGLFFNMGTLYWINWVTLPGTIAAILYLPVYFVIFAIFYTFLRQRLGLNYLFFCIPFLWTAIEYIRSLGVLGFPWTSLAYTQTYYLSLIQYASFTSVYGVSFWIVCINVVIMAIFYNHNKLKRAVTLYMFLIALFIIPWIYGNLVQPDAEEDAREKVRVALIQGNIDPFLKNDSEFWDEQFAIYDSLTQAAVNHDPQLIIWPETAVPTYLRYDRDYLSNVRNLVDSIDTPLVTGAHDYKYYSDSEYRTFNSAFLLEPGKHLMESYAKLHLVPFGERVPFTEVFPKFKDFLESLEMGEGNFSPGEALKTFHMPIEDEISGRQQEIRVPLIICFESLFPELVRRFVIHDAAQLLVIITNDGWFRRSSAPYHHAQVAVFRAIENRIDIARCANTGVSMFIDAFGRVSQQTPLFKALYVVGDVQLRNQQTFFSRHGNVFSIAISILNLIPLSIALFRQNQGVI
ncbi:apolipoprotein N-acyltransferase [candidate division KSB1 bacterium]|nr:apolipoprotein N-acyltransferase [candidate division KSB1 bacterium]